MEELRVNAPAPACYVICQRDLPGEREGVFPDFDSAQPGCRILCTLMRTEVGEVRSWYFST
jgi:hypothetical protein